MVLLVGGVILVFAAQLLVQSPGYRIPKDFPEYWAAGRLNLRGENPYDPTRLLAEQQRLEPDRDEPLMMWNPPPALAIYMPLGVIPGRLGALFWVGVQLLAVMLACDLLWRQYYSSGNRWLAQVVALPFVGTSWMIIYGQNSGLLVLGLAGFLHFAQKSKPVAAGACAALTALKPHLLAGFGLLLLVDVFSRSGRRTLVAGVSVIALSLGMAVIANPDVIGQFLVATKDPGPNATRLRDWVLPVPAYWLRKAIDPEQFWVQFLPCAVACVGLLIWRVLNGTTWNWPLAFPLIVAVSILTAPYGWIFDLTVLLVPVIWATSRLAEAKHWTLLTLFVIGQLAVTVVSIATAGGLHEYWWVAPAVLALCLLGFCVRGNSPSLALPAR